ncbi:MAG: prepilin-type N-terminal cleavage/methylation domain-containing protein [Brachymonas sp.]|nr:prepilin-type N-terminal cleavage/methylation domain-containing protein [Brachymonas sp.]
MRKESGMTLVELMVGLVIGLLVVGAAVAGLMASRSASGTVGDATQLQQQASYAFRILGQQIRQAGSLELNLDVERVAGSSTPLSAGSKVGFKVDYTQWDQIIEGKDSPGDAEFALTVGYKNYFEDQFDTSSKATLFRDCLGEGGGNDKGVYPSHIINRFTVRDGALICNGATGSTQAIIRNVNDFRVQYYVQSDAAAGAPKLKKVNAAGVEKWADVVALEVCLDLVGDVPVDLPADSTYRNCSNESVSYGGRIHQVFRNVFQLRSQGVLG